MTRQEQIVKEANLRCNSIQCYTTFCIAAEWADKTMLDKVCQWLDKEMEDYMEYYNEEHWPTVISSNYDYKKDFIEAFKKAMEEQK